MPHFQNVRYGPQGKINIKEIEIKPQQSPHVPLCKLGVKNAVIQTVNSRAQWFGVLAAVSEQSSRRI